MESNRHHIPLEIVEAIVLNLPVKSILRFSTVSKSWNSIISNPGFRKRYRGREMIGLALRLLSPPLSPFPSLSPLPADDASMLINRVQASCDELWCIEIEISLFLYNPSTTAYRKLPDRDRHLGEYKDRSVFVYGLGYDAVSDDYKLLKCPRHLGPEMESELCSWRSVDQSWRKIPPYHTSCFIMGEKFVSFNGMLHCVVLPRCCTMREGLLRFDLSTEKYGEIVQVPETYRSKLNNYISGITVLRGKLCAFFNAFDDDGAGFCLLEIDEECSSWTVKYHIECRCQALLNTPQDSNNVFYWLTPLYLYDNGDILMRYRSDSSKVLRYKKKENIFVDASCNGLILDGIVCVQTLVLCGKH